MSNKTRAFSRPVPVYKHSATKTDKTRIQALGRLVGNEKADNELWTQYTTSARFIGTGKRSDEAQKQVDYIKATAKQIHKTGEGLAEQMQTLAQIKETREQAASANKFHDELFLASLPAELHESMNKYARYTLADDTILSERLLAIAYGFSSKYEWAIDRAFYTALAAVKKMKRQGLGLLDAIEELDRQGEEQRHTKTIIILRTTINADGSKTERRIRIPKVISWRLTEHDTPIDETTEIHARLNAGEIVARFRSQLSAERAAKIERLVTLYYIAHGQEYEHFESAADRTTLYFFNAIQKRYGKQFFGSLTCREIMYIVIKYWGEHTNSRKYRTEDTLVTNGKQVVAWGSVLDAVQPTEVKNGSIGTMSVSEYLRRWKNA
jgi:hypothetical protein